jgi:hypothetical protein
LNRPARFGSRHSWPKLLVAQDLSIEGIAQ